MHPSRDPLTIHVLQPDCIACTGGTTAVAEGSAHSQQHSARSPTAAKSSSGTGTSPRARRSMSPSTSSSKHQSQHREARVTLFHNNDIHGDMLGTEVTTPQGVKRRKGGVAYLSGLLQKARKESNHPVIYVMAGDMLQGSAIDKESKGKMTVELLNALSPVVSCVGNHEIDYGLPNLLWLEKLAKFPVICANIYIANSDRRLLRSHVIIDCGDFDILFIGVCTAEVLDILKFDHSIYKCVDVRDPLTEITTIINSCTMSASPSSYHLHTCACPAQCYHACGGGRGSLGGTPFRVNKGGIIVLLSHLGLEADRKLAASIPRNLGVDVIIGAHSHTLLTEPDVVNNIPIVQVGSGTAHVGKFEFTFDTKAEALTYTWQLLNVNESCPEDTTLSSILYEVESSMAAKLNVPLCTLDEALTHPARTLPPESPQIETSMGNFFADLIKEKSGADLVLLITGTFRTLSMGPVITVGSVKDCCPFDYDHVVLCQVSGEDLRTMFRMFMSGYRDKSHNTFQVSKGVRAVYNAPRGALTQLTLDGSPVDTARTYTVALTEFVFNNREKILGLTTQQVGKAGVEPSEPREGEGEAGCHAQLLVSVADMVIDSLQRAPKPVVPAGVEGRLRVVLDSATSEDVELIRL
eukprot:TRINITY_DN4981_c0_g2_i4.p1 TRINITY_DN4981_c0_g2~~TRINITY_DN4981_c0_g2_i4.p1  ORF type:complete len:705 (-),score=143.44 TRINITY_DN4981_c0_g2_i4:114-2021(-)